jgi:DNA-binding SARP family transcriptional activator
MDYRILGAFEVRVGDRLVGLGGEKPRALLAVLLLHRNEVVSADRLIDDLWVESPPGTALRTLQAYVSRLRKALDFDGASAAEERDSMPAANGGVLLTRGRGYLLEVAPGELDLDRFRGLAERGRDALAAGRPEEAASVLSEALAIWRGPPLADFAYEPFAQAVIAQLEELHLAAVQDRVEADLAPGRGRELVGELRDLTKPQPPHSPRRPTSTSSQPASATTNTASSRVRCSTSCSATCSRTSIGVWSPTPTASSRSAGHAVPRPRSRRRARATAPRPRRHPRKHLRPARRGHRRRSPNRLPQSAR